MASQSARIRVFIAATSRDLQKHREKVDLALERMGRESGRMETFGALAEPTVAACRKRAQDADAVIVLIGHLYDWVPSVEEGGDGASSITWLEVEAAAGKPIFAFESEVLTLERARSVDEIDQNAEELRNLLRFRNRLTQLATPEKFASEDDLASKVTASIHNWLADQGEKHARLDTYLADLIRQTAHLDIRLSATGARVSAPLRPLLKDLFVPLKCSHDRSSVLGPMQLGRMLKTSRRLLIVGQPGAGKSTFLRLVAGTMAREHLGLPVARNLGFSEEPRNQAGIESRHAFIFAGQEPAGSAAQARPELPLLLNLNDLAAYLAENPGTEEPRYLLLAAAEYVCRQGGVEIDLESWKSKLDHGAGVVTFLLDGLDEISETATREGVLEILRDVLAKWDVRIVVTSRPIQLEPLQQAGFAIVTIEGFSDFEVRAFLSAWISFLYQEEHPSTLSGQAEKHRYRLEDSILSRPPVRELATNPMMLTSLCVVHYHYGQIPHARALVYAAVIQWLLQSREEQRRDQLNLSTDFAFRAFSHLSFHLLEKDIRAAIELKTAAKIVAPLFDRAWHRRPLSLEEKLYEARRWLLFECQNSGVLIEFRTEVLRFAHFSFEEYLAARELVRLPSGWSHLKDRRHNPQWAETLELYSATLYDSAGAEQVDQVLRDVIAVDDRADLPATAGAFGLFGRLVRAAEACGYVLTTDLGEGFDQAMDKVQEIFTLEGSALIPVDLRIQVAEALGAAGDPRFQPESQNFIELPGTSVALGKYPVTVAEFLIFVDQAQGYADAAFWGESWQLRLDQGWDEPLQWKSQRAYPNRPVVGISYYEALAYCTWRRLSRAVRLPSENEWELAAQRPAELYNWPEPQPEGWQAIQSRPAYPWGHHKPDAEIANYGARLDNPTPVGIFPRGAGLLGHLDLGGNVWEWCRDAIRSDSGEVLRPIRGGSFWYNDLHIMYRNRSKSTVRLRDIGFRLALDLREAEPRRRRSPL